MDSTDEYEQSGQSETESDTPIEAEFESNRTKAARAQRGRGLGGIVREVGDGEEERGKQ